MEGRKTGCYEINVNYVTLHEWEKLASSFVRNNWGGLWLRHEENFEVLNDLSMQVFHNLEFLRVSGYVASVDDGVIPSSLYFLRDLPTTCTRVELMGCELEDPRVLFQSSTNIEWLQISSKFWASPFVFERESEVPCTHLKTLIFDNAYLTDGILETVMRYVVNNGALEKLEIGSEEGITPNGWKTFGQIVTQSHCRLKSL
jgi:hypothetical protein